MRSVLVTDFFISWERRTNSFDLRVNLIRERMDKRKEDTKNGKIIIYIRIRNRRTSGQNV